MNFPRFPRILVVWMAAASILLAQGGLAAPAAAPWPPAEPVTSSHAESREPGLDEEQEPQGPVFRAEVRLALHSVAVLDTRGRPVNDLEADDFRVYEDDERQEISLFLAPNEAPLDVALVLDSSTSLFYWARIVRRSAKTFLGSLDPTDCVYLLPFNDEVGPGTWGRALDPGLARRVDGIRMHGGTALYDALLEGLERIDRTGDPPVSTSPEPAPARTGAAEAEIVETHEPAPAPAAGGSERWSRYRLRSGITAAAARVAKESPRSPSLTCGALDVGRDEAGRPSRRRAVVLLTDGQDQSSQGRFDEVLAAARSQSVPIFPVVMGEARDDPRLRRVLATLADSTGGRVIETTSPEALGQAYDEVVTLLRASYLIGYRPPEDDESGWHRVDVRITRPAYSVLHRERYRR
ncbi:MAG: VWA domain-containing protein [Acidobacteriota bacterium]